MDIADIIPHVEALIFASDHPLPAIEILDLLNQSQGFLEDKVNINQVTTALEAVTEKYAAAFYAFEVVESGGGFQFLTKPAYHATVARLNGDKYLKRLSKASLETLAIIAYKQPVTKSDIESIRGVNADYSVQKLLEKELIAIKGRREDAPGKPLLYVTSESFMDYFGLNSPDDLPRIKEVQQEGSMPTLPPVNRPLGSPESLKDAEIVAVKVVDTPERTVMLPGSNGSGTAHPVDFNGEEGETAEAEGWVEGAEAHPEGVQEAETAAVGEEQENQPADMEAESLSDVEGTDSESEREDTLRDEERRGADRVEEQDDESGQEENVEAEEKSEEDEEADNGEEEKGDSPPEAAETTDTERPS